jgi:predicted nuclease with TOPRIM domain
VESRDIQKNPFLFSIITFGPAGIDAKYTCLANMSPKKRRIEVLRHFLNLLTLSQECYSFDMAELFQLLEASVSDMTEYVSSDYEKLFSVYDNLKTDYTALQKKVKDLSDSNSSLSKENYDLKSRNDELTLKLKSLETFSDSVLSVKIQEWLSEHKGEINIADFSKVYNVPENRVEQMLNKLVTEGFIELKG